ncbi:hypothetical protein F5B18DRAFT_160272 [Nemania serpens]|nr:hypothetical protein F5B18DRAFT_160272 [Nemania serpens]
MECYSTKRPHLMLLYLSILSKMVFWYHIAATERSPLLDDTEPSIKVLGMKHLALQCELRIRKIDQEVAQLTWANRRINAIPITVVRGLTVGR